MGDGSSNLLITNLAMRHTPTSVQVGGSPNLTRLGCCAVRPYLLASAPVAVNVPVFLSRVLTETFRTCLADTQVAL
jgi:hypothetical protein